MKYLSVCSGIEAATVAWHPLGWKPFAFAEIEKFPSAVLAHHYPSVPNLGDMTKFKDWPDADIDVLVGGTPCQSFSVAGLRQGLADPRGNLCLTYLAIADRYRPEWILWENVPGVLSSDEGRDFGAFLGGLGQLGYGWSYRVLDAQYVRVDGFGRAVPQRRRRVFVVGNLRDWRRAAAVLFERESLQGNTAPRRETGQGTAVDVAPCFRAGGNQTGGDRPYGTDVDTCDSLIPYSITPSNSNTDYNAREARKSQALTGNGNRPSARGGDLIAFAQNQREEVRELEVAGAIAAEPGMKQQTYLAFAHQQGGSIDLHLSDNLALALQKSQQQAVAYDLRGREDGSQFEGPHDTANIRAASGGSSRSYVAQTWAVRRLTPRECERLQGFPDGYTDVAWRNKNWTPDGPRYKALGNSMAVNVMRWLGRRIELVSTLALTSPQGN